MADRTHIEWTDATWTPIRARHKATGKVGWHCEHVTPGCEHCYAETLNKRLGTGLPFKPGHRKDIELFLDEKMLTAPLRWRRPRMIFVCSMTDLFAEFVPDDWIDRVFAIMALAPRHTFQVLTKRPARMREYLLTPGRGMAIARRLPAAADACDRILARDKLTSGNPLPNVWLGTSVEDQPRADERIPHLLATPAAVWFISYEPALGPVDCSPWLGSPDGAQRNPGSSAPAPTPDCAPDGAPSGLRWVICGGESGPGARPMHPTWARAVRDQCQAAGVPFFFKQWGEWLPEDQISAYPVPWPPRRAVGLFSDGRRFDDVSVLSINDPDPTGLARVGKADAGRLLDGREWNEVPPAREPRP